MDVYTIQVKSAGEGERAPAERWYNPETVAGLAWVHGALALTAALLAALALAPTTAHPARRNATAEGAQEERWCGSECAVGVSAGAVALSAALACACGALAALRWYQRRHIARLLGGSALSALVALGAVAAVAAADRDLGDFYRDREPFAAASGGAGRPPRRALSVNVIVAACLECAWSLLSARVAWRGVRAARSRARPAPRALPRRRLSLVTELKAAGPSVHARLRVLPGEASAPKRPSQPPPAPPAPPSWGDSPPHPVYTQDTLDLRRALAFDALHLDSDPRSQHHSGA